MAVITVGQFSIDNACRTLERLMSRIKPAAAIATRRGGLPARVAASAARATLSYISVVFSTSVPLLTDWLLAACVCPACWIRFRAHSSLHSRRQRVTYYSVYVYTTGHRL